MPTSGFLQRFHDLAEPAEATRVSAAIGVKRALETASGSKSEEAENVAENLSYAIRRLVRGVQSARLCCRQGFSLGLAELLSSHPEELAGVLQLVRQLTEIQSGLKSAEYKARLMGRFCVYAAVCEAGCLQQLTVPGKSSKSWTPKEVLGELGRGLLELYGARPFLREPVVRMATGICRELCSLGQHAWLPELFAEWNLERKHRSEKHVHITSLVLELRSIYQDARVGGKAVAAWPACVKTSEGEEHLVVGMAQGLGDVLSSCGLGEQVPQSLRSFCQLLLRSQGQDSSAVATTWEQLDAALFPEGSPQVSQMRSLRALGELVSELCKARAECGSKVPAEAVFTELFGSLRRGFQILLQALARARWMVHPAAVFVQHRLVAALGAPQPAPAAEAAQGRKGAQKLAKAKSKAATPAPPWPLGDAARLAVLGALQKYDAFPKVPTAYQRQWQQALLAPLSSPGLRARCKSLLAASEPSSLGVAARAAQLEQLAIHSRATDEVILGVLCHFIAMAYFSPAPGQEPVQARPLRDFCSWAGLQLESTGASEDLSIPIAMPGKAEAETQAGAQGPWRTKLWACLPALFRRTLPDMAAKVIAAGAAFSAGETDVEGDANADQPVKTFAYTGMLADGSLLVARLHEWWDFLDQGATASTPSSKKKRRSGGAEGKSGSPSSLECLVSLSTKDRELRRRCLEVCKTLGNSESDQQPDELSQRHRNAMCGFLLAMLLALVTSESESEKAALRSPIEQVLTPAVSVSLNKEMTSTQLSEALAPISLVAAELYVNTGGLVKDAARMAWRELGTFTSQETLMSLCSSVRGDAENEAEDEGEGEGEDEEDGDNENEAEGAALPGDDVRARALAEGLGGEAGEAEELILDADGLWDQLLDDGDGSAGDGNSLLASFASPNLSGAPPEKKLSKWEQRVRQQQEEAVHKFREVELLEVFIVRFVEKRHIAFQVLQELFEALMAAAQKASGSAKQQKEGEAEKSNKGKRRRRADAALRRLHVDLAQRIAKVLAKALKKLRGRTKLRDISSWYSAEEWASRARSLSETASGSKATVASQQLVDVGATLLHFLCMAHRSAKLGPAGGEAEGWELAEELLASCLQDWAGKRDAERWCAAVFAAFAVRTPQVLFGLPWLETLRANRKHFIQRMQLTFFTQRLLRSSPAETAAAGSREAALIAGFAELCAELLEASIGTATPAAAPAGPADAAQPQSTAQRKKLQRDALLGLRAALRTASRGRDPLPELAPGSPRAGRLAATMARLQEALPGRRGEIYQLCLHIQRVGLGQRPAPNKRQRQSRSGSPAAKRQASGRGSDVSPQGSKREKKVET